MPSWITHEKLLGDFIDSIQVVLGDIKNKNLELKDVKETDRTMGYHTEKIIKKWFMLNGGL